MTDDHAPWCQTRAFRHEDAAQRISDTWNLHRIAGGYDAIGKWFAARLHDGSTDNVLYDDKNQAVRNQHHNEKFYLFMKVGPQSIIPCEAAVVLHVQRRLYDAGMRLADPDHKHGGPDVVTRLTTEDQLSFARTKRVTGLVMPWEKEYYE